ncbi:unnamed protein product, partial [Meganyctiphanes norvegica]
DETLCINKPSTCTTIEASCQDYNVCYPTRKTQRLCELESCERNGQIYGEQKMCPAGQLYDLSARSCVTAPTDKTLCDNTPPPPPSTCTIVEASCQDYNVCYPQKETLRLCEQESCKRNGLIIGEQKMCPAGQLYDFSARICVTAPTDETLCINKPSTCTTIEASCQDYNVCYPTRKTQRLCELESCERNGQIYGEQKMCPAGQLYDLSARSCVTAPTDKTLCDNTPPPPPSTCTIVEASCQDYNVCYPTKKTQRLCERESCERNGQIIGEPKKCPAGQLYDLSARICVAAPTDKTLCINKPSTCTTIEVSCQDYNVCYPTRKTQRLCELESCERNGQIYGEQKMCPAGQLYDLSARSCVTAPTDKTLCDNTPPPPPSTCNIVEASCQDYNVCYPTKKTQRLCERESCERNGQIIGEPKMCPAGQLYDLSARICVTAPT